jgi:hypothetical protein
VLLLAVYVGMFGETAQGWLQQQLMPIRTLYRAYKGAVDLVAVVLGTTIPAVTGGLAILKSFYYAEINLPKRLQELADQPRVQHLHERPSLLAYVRAPFKTSDFLTPTILANPLSQMLELFGWVNVRNRARKFATEVEQFADEIRVLGIKREDVENRKVTGHLLRAACYEAEASAGETGTLDWRKRIESALKEYKAILELRSDDLDALDGAVVQYHRLGDEPAELQGLEAIIAVAGRQKKHLAHARALRLSASIINRRSSPIEWNAARARLVTGRRLVEHEAADNNPEAAELAETLLLYGDVQTKREKFTTARKALNRSGVLFGKIPGDAGTHGKKRVEEGLARLDEAAGDKEAVGG